MTSLEVGGWVDAARATRIWGAPVTARTCLLGVVFFFFQAEDGIRDLTVTGVQTCALPISRRSLPRGFHSGACHRRNYAGERPRLSCCGCRGDRGHSTFPERPGHILSRPVPAEAHALISGTSAGGAGGSARHDKCRDRRCRTGEVHSLRLSLWATILPP